MLDRAGRGSWVVVRRTQDRTLAQASAKLESSQERNPDSIKPSRTIRLVGEQEAGMGTMIDGTEDDAAECAAHGDVRSDQTPNQTPDDGWYWTTQEDADLRADANRDDLGWMTENSPACVGPARLYARRPVGLEDPTGRSLLPHPGTTWDNVIPGSACSGSLCHDDHVHQDQPGPCVSAEASLTVSVPTSRARALSSSPSAPPMLTSACDPNTRSRARVQAKGL